MKMLSMGPAWSEATVVVETELPAEVTDRGPLPRTRMSPTNGRTPKPREAWPRLDEDRPRPPMPRVAGA